MGEMAQELLPLFPLPVVLFPRTQLPLHIFEDRYREMVGAAIRNKAEFGVVLAGENGVAHIGCTAIVEKVTHRYDDGRLDVVTLGLRRFEILDLNNEKSYLRGAVTFFNDEETEPPPPELAGKAVAGYRQLRNFLGEGPPSEPEWNDPQLSFQLAQVISDVDFRQRLLMLRSEAERIRLLADFFPEHLSRQKYVSQVRQVAPLNGRGPRPPID